MFSGSRNVQFLNGPPIPNTSVIQIPVQNRAVYINRRVLGIEKIRSIENACKKSDRVIYCNPKFMKSSTSNSSAISTCPKGIIKENVPKIHFNPKFLSKNFPPSSGHQQEKSDKVFVNPAFLNVGAQATTPFFEKPVSAAAPSVPCPSFESSSQKLGTTEFTSKYKLNRVLRCETEKIPDTHAVKKNKYKLVNKKRRKSKSETTPLSPLEFNKTKYSLRRKVTTNIKNKFKLNNLKKRKINEADDGKLVPVKMAQPLGLDPFKKLGRTKLVRTSILQSMIEARRCPLKYSRRTLVTKERISVSQACNIGKIPRKRLGSESKRSKRRSLKTRYKIVHRNGNEPSSVVSEAVQPIRQRGKRKKTSVVFIGGTAYKVTPNKLTKKADTKGGRVINIQGVNYSVNKGAKSLRKLDKSLGSSSVPSRRSLTAVFKNCRTATNIIKHDHTSKMILRSSRKRSIMTLTAKLRKHNVPCTFFVRFGYCKGLESGKCHKSHDKKYVALCKQFLRGNCKNDSCLLSHDPIPEKMPLCEYYLSGGHCLVDDCPYLHVNHGPDAPICRLFLRGFCPSGVNCSKRHELVCPVLLQKGVCPRKKCPYPHPRRYSSVQKTVPKGALEQSTEILSKESENKSEMEQKKESNEVSRERYFCMDLTLPESSGLEDNEEGVSANASLSNDDIILLDETSEHEKFPFPELPDFLPLS